MNEGQTQIPKWEHNKMSLVIGINMPKGVGEGHLSFPNLGCKEDFLEAKTLVLVSEHEQELSRQIKEE
jgi:hypothetical protein